MILKHRDTEVLRFEWLGPQQVRIVSVNDDARRFLPLEMKGEATDESLWKWISHRTVPRGRKYILATLRRLGIESSDVRAIVEFSRGLSLNDVHWMTEDDFTGTWKDYNLYDNDFSEDVASLALTGIGLAPEEKHTSSPEFSTNGMLRKCWRRVKGQVLLYKGGTEGAINAGYEMYSEFYAAQIAERMGLAHVEYGLSRFKKVLCSTCSLFTSDRYGYLPAGRILDCAEALKDPRFAPIFFFDALIFNTDRHMGNFGFFIDNDTNEIVGPAPIFDNGYGLFSLATYSPERPEYHEFGNLKKYLNRVGPALYDRWLDVPEKLTTELLSKLTLLRGFRFKRHKRYNLPDDRLAAIELFLQHRVEAILEHGKAADELLIATNARIENEHNSGCERGKDEITQKNQDVNSVREAILENVKAYPFVTIEELSEILEIGKSVVERHLGNLKREGRLVREGSDKTGAWRVV